jgi:hypothetical protein
MEAIRSSEKSVHTRSTLSHIPEDGLLHSHRCENLKPYIIFNIFTASISALDIPASYIVGTVGEAAGA